MKINHELSAEWAEELIVARNDRQEFRTKVLVLKGQKLEIEENIQALNRKFIAAQEHERRIIQRIHQGAGLEGKHTDFTLSEDGLSIVSTLPSKPGDKEPKE